MESRILGDGKTVPRPYDKERFGESPANYPFLSRGRKVIESSLLEHPAMGLGAALLLGIVLGWFVKRR